MRFGSLTSFLLLFLLAPSLAFCAGTVSGKITDMYTGEPIPGAKVIIEGTALVTSTAKDGGYSIGNVPVGSVRVSAGAHSYNKKTKSVSVPEGSVVVVNFVLEIGAVIQAEEVVVKEKKPVVDKTPQTSSHKFKIEELEDNAGSFEDVAKALKKLPGVVQSSSFSADMYVRGAQNWENLILIDDFLLLNPYHFGGGLSIINSDLVDEVTFYAGGFPAKYPFASGSILDVRYKDGNRERVDGEISVSMLSSSAYISGPIKKDITWIVSARRSYYDWLIDILDYDNVPVPVFSDYLLRGTYEPGNYNKFILLLSRSADSVHLNIDEENASTADEGKAAYSALTQMFALNWQLFPTQWFLMETTATHQIINLDANLTSQTPLFAQSQLNATYVHNETSFQLHPRNLLTVGGDYAYLTIDLNARIRVVSWVLGSNFESELEYFDTDFDHDAPVEVAGGYVQDEWEIVKDKLHTNVGARFDHYQSDGQGWMISPRASVSWSVKPESVLKASWGIYYFPPFNILATDEELGNPDLLPQHSMHHVLGYEQGLGENAMLRLETFYILFDDLQFQDYQSNADSLDGITGIIAGDPSSADVSWSNSGYGKSYGLEFFLQKKLSGKWDGWLAYTLMEVLYNDGMGQYGWFNPYQDQRHTLNIVANYRPIDHWTFSGTFALYSGKPYTKVVDWTKNFGGSIFQFWTAEQGPLNDERLPLFHKLDVRIERQWDLERDINLIAFLEIYNLYNSRNVFDYWYAEEEGINKPVRRTIYDMPFLPFLGVKAEF
jgi:hypothetical protein